MIVLWVLTGVALLASLLADRHKTLQVLRRALAMLQSVLPLLLGVLAAVSLLLAAVPASTLAEILGGSGPLSFVVALLVGSVALIPAFVAYPLAAVLRDLGAGVGVLAAFVTTLMMVGVTTLPIEISFFGRRVALLRNALAFGGAVVVALVMVLVLV